MMTAMKWTLMVLCLLAGGRAEAIMYARDMPEYTEYQQVFGMHAPRRIVVDHENRKWIMATHAVFMYDGVEWTAYESDVVPRYLNDIQVDRQDHIWLASDNGIAEWDGESWTIYNQENSGLPSNAVWNIRIGPTGDLWVMTDKTISCYDGNTWENNPFLGRNKIIYELEVDDENKPWLRIDNRIYRLEGTNWREIVLEDAADWHMYSILKRKDGVMMLTTKTEIWAFEEGEWILEYQAPYSIFGKLLFVDDRGRVWTTWLNCCQGDVFAEIRLNDITDGLIDRDGYFWGVGNRSAHSFKPKFLDLNEPRHNSWLGLDYTVNYYPGDEISITWLADGVDEIDIAWSDGRPVWQPIAEHVDAASGRYKWRIPPDIIHESMFQKYLKLGIFSTGQEGFADSTDITVVVPDLSSTVTLYPYMAASSLYEDKAGNIWFNDNNGNLVKYCDDEFTTYHPGGDVEMERLTVAPDGCFWMTYNGQEERGVIKFDGKEFTKWPFDVSRNTIYGLTVSPYGYVWCAIGRPRPEGGMGYIQLYRFNGVAWIPMNGDIEYSMYHYFALESAPDGTIWLSSEHGLWVFEQGTWKFTGDLPEINSLFWDRNGDMWATENETLYKQNGEDWIAYPVDVPKYENEHFFLYDRVVVDNKNRFWFTQYEGPLVFDNGTWQVLDCDNQLRMDFLYSDHNGALWFNYGSALARYGDPVIPVMVSDSPVPAPFTLDAPYPNPFNLTVTIPFTLPETARVEAAIYSITGQRVKTLATDFMPAGAHSLRWDGRDDAGATVSSGLYIVRLESGGKSAARRMVLVK